MARMVRVGCKKCGQPLAHLGLTEFNVGFFRECPNCGKLAEDEIVVEIIEEEVIYKRTKTRQTGLDTYGSNS